MPSPAASCLIIGAIIGAALWALGDRTSAIVLLSAEALAWAALYALVGRER